MKIPCHRTAGRKILLRRANAMSRAFYRPSKRFSVTREIIQMKELEGNTSLKILYRYFKISNVYAKLSSSSSREIYECKSSLHTALKKLINYQCHMVNVHWKHCFTSLDKWVTQVSPQYFYMLINIQLKQKDKYQYFSK